MGSILSPIRGYSYCSYNKLCFFNQWPMRVTMSWPVYWWSLWLYPYPHWPKKMSPCSRPHWRVSTIMILKSFTGKWLNVHVYLVYCSINFRSITSFYFLICQRWYIYFNFLYIYTVDYKLNSWKPPIFHTSTDSAIHIYKKYILLYVYICMHYREPE